MSLHGWKEFCRKAWENEYDFLRIHSFAEIGEGRYIMRKCNKTSFIERTPEKKTFLKTYDSYSQTKLYRR